MNSADVDVIRASWGRYKGVLYGESSMAIYLDGKEILHTGFRSKDIQTQEDLMKQLKDMPKLMKTLYAHWDDLYNDKSDESDI